MFFSRLFAIFAFAASLVAAVPPSSVVVHETSTSSQTDRTVVIPRYFAEGEIGNYPIPAVAGQAISVWQADVKNRWRDGSATVSVTAASNEYPIVITAADHGYQTGERVTISAVEGNTAANGTWRIYRLNKDKFFIRTAGNGAYTTGGSALGPGYGSVRFAIVALVIPSLTGSGSVTVTFSNSVNPCSSGNQSACDAAGLDEAGMLAFEPGGAAWDAEIKATQGDTVVVSARTMVDAAHFEYWTRGPAATVVIAEDKSSSRTYDFGWTCTANCTTDYSTATWETDATHKSLHPRFTLWFFPADGTPHVRYDYVLENTWADHLQDQSYALQLTKGAGDTEVLAKAEFTHYGATRWRKGGDLISGAWQPSAPGATNLDLNLPYMIYSKILPSYNLSLVQGAAEIAEEVAYAAAVDFDINDEGEYQKYFPQTGGRPEIAYVPQWNVRWLYTMDADLLSIVLQHGDISGWIPIHFRESYTTATKYYVDYDRDGDAQDADDNIAGNLAYGRWVSVHARPTLWYGNFSYGDAEDKITAVAALSTSHGWSVDTAHQGSFAFIPYLATGDPYFLEEMQAWGNYDPIYADGSGTGNFWGRHGAWGILSFSMQTRGVAWAARNIAHALVFSPDGMAEKELLQSVFDAHMSYEEGTHLLKGGPYAFPMTGATAADPCPSGTYDSASYVSTANTPYCFGWRSANLDSGDLVAGPSRLGLADQNDGSLTIGDYAWIEGDNVGRLNSSFMLAYKSVSYAAISELIPAAKFISDHHGRFQVGAISHPDSNPWLAPAYRVPSQRAGADNWWFQSWGAWLNGFTSACQAKAAYNDNICWDSGLYLDARDGFGPVTQAAVALHEDLIYGQASGASAWTWVSTNFPNQTYEDTVAETVVPKWAFVPRRDPTRLLSAVPGSTTALLSYVAPTATACTVTVDDDSAFGSPLIAAATDGGGARARQYVATGLTAETEYFYRIACPDDPYGSGNTDGSLTTEASGSGVTFTIRLATPSGLSIDNAIVDYGATAGLGSTTSEVSCASGCTVDVSATAGVPLYYRWKYRDSGDSVLLTSAIAIAVP